MLIALILCSVGLAALAQITLKAGMNEVRSSFGVVGLGTDSLRAVATTPTVWLGLVLFGLSAVVWLGVLSRVSLSFAYPFASRKAAKASWILIYDSTILVRFYWRTNSGPSFAPKTCNSCSMAG